MRGPAELSGSQPPDQNMAYKSQIIGEARDVDFSDFMWMQGDLEEFDRRVIEELLHEDSSSETENYLDDMLEPDELAWYYSNVPDDNSEANLVADMEELSLSGSRFMQYALSNTNQLPVISHDLNPNAPVFVPGSNNGEGEAENEQQIQLREPSEAGQSSFASRLNPEAPVFVPKNCDSQVSDKEEER